MLVDILAFYLTVVYALLINIKGVYCSVYCSKADDIKDHGCPIALQASPIIHLFLNAPLHLPTTANPIGGFPSFSFHAS
jgi:hypothetical protein